MNGKVIVWISIAVLVISVNVVFAQSTNALYTFQMAYSNAAVKITAETQRQNSNALAEYSKTLDMLLITSKQKGDFDLFAVIKAEKQRFADEKTVWDIAPATALTNAVDAYQKLALSINTDALNRRVSLLRKYISALSRLVKDLMAKDMMSDAQAATDMKHAAEIDLAIMESKIPKESEPVTPTGGGAATKSIEESHDDTASPQSKTRKIIPKSSHVFQGHHYLVFDKPVGWEEACTLCAEAGGHLVQINSEKENEFVLQLVRNCKLSQFWLDLTTVREKGKWTTSDGKRQTFFHWAVTQPDNYRGLEHWGVFKRIGGQYGPRHKTYPGEWEDWVSTGNIGYICEWDNDAGTVGESSPVPIIVP